MTRTERRAIAERGNRVAIVYFLNFWWRFSLKSDGVSPPRDGAALSLRHGKRAQKPGDSISDTTSVDVPICLERAERRASALARRPRATAFTAARQRRSR